MMRQSAVKAQECPDQQRRVNTFRMAEQHRREAAASNQDVARPQHSRRSTRLSDYDYSGAQLDADYLDELIAKVKAGDVINLLSA